MVEHLIRSMDTVYDMELGSAERLKGDCKNRVENMTGAIDAIRKVLIV